MEILTKEGCSYCVKLKELLDNLKIPYNTITEPPIGQFKEGEKFTYPQVWFNGEHIPGGYTNMEKMLISPNNVRRFRQNGFVIEPEVFNINADF